jgi:hypothetical protein
LIENACKETKERLKNTILAPIVPEIVQKADQMTKKFDHRSQKLSFFFFKKMRWRLFSHRIGFVSTAKVKIIFKIPNKFLFFLSKMPPPSIIPQNEPFFRKRLKFLY